MEVLKKVHERFRGFQFKRVVSANELLPRYYGAAYKPPEQYSVVAYPIPINYVVHWLRRLYVKIKSPDLTDIYIEAEADGYRKGYNHGYEEGLKHGKAEGLDRTLSTFASLTQNFREHTLDKQKKS